jgi:hypothetical protein
MAVGAGLAACTVILTLIRPLEIHERVVGLSIEFVLCILLGALSWGLFHVQRWAWMASLLLCGALSLLVLSLGVPLLVALLTEGFGRPHGVTAVGQALLCFLVPLGLLIFGSPVVILWRDRSSFRDAGSED